MTELTATSKGYGMLAGIELTGYVKDTHISLTVNTILDFVLLFNVINCDKLIIVDNDYTAKFLYDDIQSTRTFYYHRLSKKNKAMQVLLKAE